MLSREKTEDERPHQLATSLITHAEHAVWGHDLTAGLEARNRLAGLVMGHLPVGIGDNTDDA
jgi:hypothetical protein